MSDHTYAGELDAQGVCLRCIVGTAEWAEANLGGTWQDSATKVGIGWTWSEADGWRPPQPFPSWTWDGTEWVAPVPYPTDGGSYYWDEAQYDATGDGWVLAPMP